MFSLTHTYIASKAFDNTDPLFLFGAIFPDIRGVAYDDELVDLHQNSERFYDFVLQNYSNKIALAQGALTHYGNGRGIDHYSDDKNIGYAKTKGKQLRQDVINLLGEGDEFVVFDHNFIEVAVELKTSENHQLKELYQTIWPNVNLEEIAKIYAEAFNMNLEKVMADLDKLNYLIQFERLSDIEKLTSNLSRTILNKTGIGIQLPRAISISQKAIEIVTPDYQNFLDETACRLRENFPDF